MEFLMDTSDAAPNSQRPARLAHRRATRRAVSGSVLLGAFRGHRRWATGTGHSAGAAWQKTRDRLGYAWMHERMGKISEITEIEIS